MQDKLHGDLEHKDMALEIDRDCHEMHNDAIDIKHHDGIEEEDVSGSVPQSWAKFSKNNVEESQGEFSRFRGSLSCNPPLQAAGRSATRQLRYDVNNLINNAASDMSVHWNKTNRAFTDRLVFPLPINRPHFCPFRISECQDAHRNLKSNLILTKNVSSFRLFLSSPPTSWTWVLANDKQICRQQQDLPQRNNFNKNISHFNSWGRFGMFCSGHLHVLTLGNNITSER